MFFVFNKEKINSYVLLITMVVILFGIAFSMRERSSIEASVNVEQTKNVQEKNDIINDIDILESKDK